MGVKTGRADSARRRGRSMTRESSGDVSFVVGRPLASRWGTTRSWSIDDSGVVGGRLVRGRSTTRESSGEDSFVVGRRLGGHGGTSRSWSTDHSRVIGDAFRRLRLSSGTTAEASSHVANEQYWHSVSSGRISTAYFPKAWPWRSGGHAGRGKECHRNVQSFESAAEQPLRGCTSAR